MKTCSACSKKTTNFSNRQWRKNAKTRCCIECVVKPAGCIPQMSLKCAVCKKGEQFVQFSSTQRESKSHTNRRCEDCIAESAWYDRASKRQHSHAGDGGAQVVDDEKGIDAICQVFSQLFMKSTREDQNYGLRCDECGIIYDFDSGELEMEIVVLVAWIVNEVFRLEIGTKGNKTQNSSSMMLFIFLSFLAALGNLFFYEYQSFRFDVDIVVNSISLFLNGLQIFLSIATVLRFLRASTAI